MIRPTRRSLIPTSYFLLAALLISACASPQQRLTTAALSGHSSKLGKLLKPGVDINAPAIVKNKACRPMGRALTPLQAAACAGHTSVVKFLLENKADPNITGQTGESPLVMALARGHFDAVETLVRAGASANAKDDKGVPALHIAARLGKTQWIGFLLNNGAEIDGTDSKGRTALMIAGHGTAINLLLKNGAELALVDNAGRNALHHAAAKGWHVAAIIFLKKGSDSQLRDNKGMIPLTLARASKKSGVITVFTKEAGRLIKKSLGSGDRAAAAGDQEAAMSVYTAALAQATSLGGSLEGEIRVKILRYAAGLKNPPAIPPSAREHLVRAKYLIKKGRNASEVEKEMAAAVDAAPWWAEGYYNLGLVQADRNRFVAAMATLTLFIKAAPNSPKAESAQDKIFELKIAKEEADAIAGMTGNWGGWSVRVNGTQLRISAGRKTFDLTMTQGIVEGSLQSSPYPGSNNCTIPGQMHPVTGKVSDDLKTITLSHNWSTYDTRFHCVDMFGLASNCCLLCKKVCDAVSIVSTSRQNVRISR